MNWFIAVPAGGAVIAVVLGLLIGRGIRIGRGVEPEFAGDRGLGRGNGDAHSARGDGNRSGRCPRSRGSRRGGRRPG